MLTDEPLKWPGPSKVIQSYLAYHQGKKFGLEKWRGGGGRWNLSTCCSVCLNLAAVQLKTHPAPTLSVNITVTLLVKIAE